MSEQPQQHTEKFPDGATETYMSKGGKKEGPYIWNFPDGAVETGTVISPRARP